MPVLELSSCIVDVCIGVEASTAPSEVSISDLRTMHSNPTNSSFPRKEILQKNEGNDFPISVMYQSRSTQPPSPPSHSASPFEFYPTWNKNHTKGLSLPIMRKSPLWYQLVQALSIPAIGNYCFATFLRSGSVTHLHTPITCVRLNWNPNDSRPAQGRFRLHVSRKLLRPGCWCREPCARRGEARLFYRRKICTVWLNMTIYNVLGVLTNSGFHICVCLFSQPSATRMPSVVL